MTLQSVEGVERWMPYRPMQFERNDMANRQEQLQIRTGECIDALDLLGRINDGVTTDDLVMLKAKAKRILLLRRHEFDQIQTFRV